MVEGAVGERGGGGRCWVVLCRGVGWGGRGGRDSGGGFRGEEVDR